MKLIGKYDAQKILINFKSRTPLANTVIQHIILSQCVLREIGCRNLDSFELDHERIRILLSTLLKFEHETNLLLLFSRTLFVD